MLIFKHLISKYNMKNTITIFGISLFFLAWTSIQGQVLLAKWTFPTGTATDSLADGGISANLTMAIRTEGGTSAIDFSKNGFTTKSAQATGWNDGAMTKSWVVTLQTTGYKTLKLSSKQQSGGNNPGPRDYKVQYKLQYSSEWSDVPNSVMVTANDWTTASLDSIALPDSCANRSLIFLRWIMTTNTNSAENPVIAAGINKIDDIYITGKEISTGMQKTDGMVATHIWPNPAAGPFTIHSSEPIDQVDFFDLNGRVVYSLQVEHKTQITIDPVNLRRGAYLVKPTAKSGSNTYIKLVVM
jgi:hypothetical protein